MSVLVTVCTVLIYRCQFLRQYECTNIIICVSSCNSMFCTNIIMVSVLKTTYCTNIFLLSQLHKQSMYSVVSVVT